eukprot:s3359_g9.t1
MGRAEKRGREPCERSAASRRMESRIVLGANRQGIKLMEENLPDQCAAVPSRLCAKQNRSAIADVERRVRFQEPDIIEVVSWKDATHLMQYKGKKKLEEEDLDAHGCPFCNRDRRYSDVSLCCPYLRSLQACFRIDSFAGAEPACSSCP